MKRSTAAAAAVALLAATAAPRAAAQGTFILQLLNLTRFPDARCLDGSPGGYWIRQGSGDNAAKAMWHFQGGGWCIDEADCVGRSKTSLGSSTSWPATGTDGADGGIHGMISADPTVNPGFATWMSIFVGYCDGASYSGAVTDPVDVNGTTIYFKGRAIMDAIIDDLYERWGLAQVTEFILKGTSAGGLATYLHADYVASRLPARTKFAAAPGAGFFLDYPSAAGTYIYSPNYAYVFSMQNVSGSVNADCIAAHNASAAWRCFLAAETLPYIKSRVFVSNAVYDSWQASNIMGISCDPARTGSCSSAVQAYVGGFRSAMIKQVTAGLKPGDGAFLQSCFVHIVENVDVSWNGTLVATGTGSASQTQIDTFTSWWEQDSNAEHVVIDSPAFNPGCYAD